MVYCCVPLCKSSTRTSTGVAFHEFPVTEIRNDWLKKISRQAEGQLPPTLLDPGTVAKSSPEPTTEPLTKFLPEPTLEPLESPCLEPMLNPKPVPKPSPEPISELLTKSSLETTLEPLESPCLEPTLNLRPVAKAPLEPSPQPTMKPAPVRAKAVKAHGTQTRLSNPRLTRLLKQVKTVTRKCQRLLKKRDELQQMVSALRKQAVKTEAVMKQGNFLLLQEKVDANDPKALFLQEQLTYLGAPKSHWREETVRNFVLWHAKSPCAYRLLRETGVLSLPSRSTLKRYIGACSGEVVSSLIKQRIHVEAKLHSGQDCICIVMSIFLGTQWVPTYQKQSDSVHGLVDLGGAEADFGLQDHLATHLLCFGFVGLSTHYRLPVGYYFTKALTGEQLQLLALKVMASIEEAGFRVVRLVGDNHSSNCKVFSNLSGGSIVPVVTHPLDEARELYLSFDYCHVVKNVRSQFLEAKRIFRNNGTLIIPDYLRRLFDLQQRQGAFKMVRCLTKKHLWPSNFEKMNVGRAVDIFSPRGCLPTVEFMELVYKWFVLHNLKSTTVHVTSRDAMRMPFWSPDDERLSWLQDDCLAYFASWKASTTYKMEFLSTETYEALRVAPSTFSP
ncbi:hypothetical protein HPB47_002572 [Ixodes persulcatus]|uniref:Uncharacterized protein n=1 Tax=Ixodes persulcatus TaxID=34615 RepID=A0AC60PKU4_IXOPE|nr:hypothetical protein HPB47_002572 [Ixodes persulcatus]